MFTTEQLEYIAVHYGRGMSAREIAEKIGMKTNAVRKVASKLRKKGVDIPLGTWESDGNYSAVMELLQKNHPELLKQ